jgi:hypothetical protein
MNKLNKPTAPAWLDRDIFVLRLGLIGLLQVKAWLAWLAWWAWWAW